MNVINKINDFFSKHSALIKIIVASILSVSFVGTMVFSIFGGDEFEQQNTSSLVKGMLDIKEGNYRTSYLSGDTFVFDKESSKVLLYAKDPSIENVVVIDDLPASEYGFKVNGQGKIIEDASDIVVTTDTETIDVVSVVYPNLKKTLDINVLSGIDSSKLKSSLLLEAEKDANVYKSNVLLTNEQLRTEPDGNKPYISSAGTTVDGTNCSGGACLRNFQQQDMKVEFTFVASEEVDAQLKVMVCKRKENVTFGTWYKTKLNDVTITSVESQSVPSGTGYFEPFELQAVTIHLSRGINVITFESGNLAGTTSPGNLDAISITTSSQVIGSSDAITE